MTATEIVKFVHSLGSWCKEESYRTHVDRIKDSYPIYNDFPFPSEPGRASDCVSVRIGTNGRGKIVGRTAECGLDRCSEYVRKFYKQCLDEGVFDRYVIDREDW